MVTISHLVEKFVNERPLLLQAIEQDIVSFGNLAEKLEEEIASELKKNVNRSAVVMALRRYAEKVRKTGTLPKFNFHSEIIMKTNLCDIAVQKSQTITSAMQRIQKIPDFSQGDTFNLIHGNYEVSIITNMKHLARMKKELSAEKIIKTEAELVALSLRFSKEFLYTPGVIATLVQRLTWEDINIYELISTFTELTFIISKKDAAKGYDALQRLVGG
jgi:aspartokinase